MLRVIDLHPANSQVALAIEHVRMLVQLYPDQLGERHVFTLMAFAENFKSDLHCLAVETLLEVACKRPRLACECKLFHDLVNFILVSGTDNEFLVQLIMQCLFKVLDDDEHRALVNYDDLFSSLVAPFVDAEYVPVLYGASQFASSAMLLRQPLPDHHRGINFNFNAANNNQTSSASEAEEPKIENILASCSNAIEAIFGNFVGISCFTANNSKCLRSLLTPLTWFKTAAWGGSGSGSSGNDCHYSNFFHNKKNQLPRNFDRTKQLVVLSQLINLFYRIFQIDVEDLEDLAKRLIQQTPPPDRQDHPSHSLDEGFVNSECEAVLASYDSFFIEKSDQNENAESDESRAQRPEDYSYSPNNVNSQKTFLVKIFIEAEFFEMLLDLYFSLPLSFNQMGLSTANLGQYAAMSETGISSSLALTYQNISFKCLNLFAELFYSANNFFFNEVSNCSTELTANECKSFWVHWDPSESTGILLDPLGSFWIHWDPSGSTGILLDPLGSFWIHWDPSGSTGILLDPLGSFWIHWDPSGSTGILLDPLGSFWIHWDPSGSTGILLDPLGSFWIHWDPSGSTGILLDPLGSFWIHWDPSGSTGILLDPLGSFWIHWDPSGSTGILLDPLGSFWIHWDPSGSTGILLDPLGPCWKG